MSKVKTPQQKTRLSYADDRRNPDGEHAKSHRKDISRIMRRSHQDERRAVGQALLDAEGEVAEEVADETQSQVQQKARLKQLRAFRKSPDRPLGQVVERRLRSRRPDE